MLNILTRPSPPPIQNYEPLLEKSTDEISFEISWIEQNALLIIKIKYFFEIISIKQFNFVAVASSCDDQTTIYFTELST
jgi:hypothetical protein